ncbi:hypothetical protein [Rivibacter subsaxonicus]|uniref:Uncharacterized protein n=1 Tax=Rivibacter subsaxonicus TaxID=457575 RepID=A0A4Q7VE61_9BURK|nr:hypothetical protein [Rivibacter subsaxonicus]RZT93833.1 hypothetical protein EV670_3389 [Rivibacter subsaxonicus]
MLGERIGESKGQVISQRVLPSDGGPKMETSFRTQGTLLGVGTSETGTYWSRLRPDGTLYGEGQGIVMSAEGDAATWVGQGVGTLKKDGSASYRGAVYVQTASPKWAGLNSIACVYEYELDAQGATRSQLYEWK